MIVGGVLTLLYPIVGNYLANRERSEAVSEYDDTMKKMSQKEKDKQWNLAKAYNEFIYNKQEGLPTGNPVVYNKIMKQGDVMGTVDIPAIDIKQMPFFTAPPSKHWKKAWAISSRPRFQLEERIRIR